MPKRSQIILVLVLLPLAALPALGAEAALGRTVKPHVLHFKGRTKEGTKISFTYDGKWLDGLHTLLPETCISVQGGVPRVDMTMWALPYKFWVNYTVKLKHGDPTENYTITTHRHGNRISGQLEINYSLLGTDGFGDYVIWHCLATGNFNLSGH